MSQGLNIAFFGSSLVSAYWNGAATYYRGIIRALHALGHRVTFYEPDAFERQQHRDLPDPPWAKVVVYQPTEAEVRRQIDSARGADVVIKASGVGVHDDLVEEAVLSLTRRSVQIVFWDVDAPATLSRVEENASDPFRALIPSYNLILTYGGGEPVVSRYLALGARACVPVYNALDPATHHPVRADPRFACDLALLANRLPDREARVEEFFLSAAQACRRKEFLLGGNGWQSRSLPRNVRALGHVYTGDHNAFNCTPLAVLNVTRDSMVANGWSPATRVFEAAGAGACLITDAWPGLEDFLEPGRECLAARTGEEVVDHISCLSPERARVIGRAALARVLGQHTYAKRAAQVQEILTGHAAPTLTH